MAVLFIGEAIFSSLEAIFSSLEAMLIKREAIQMTLEPDSTLGMPILVIRVAGAMNEAPESSALSASYSKRKAILFVNIPARSSNAGDSLKEPSSRLCALLA